MAKWPVWLNGPSAPALLVRPSRNVNFVGRTGKWGVARLYDWVSPLQATAMYLLQPAEAYTISSGDPGGDLFTSPADPAFWIHHGNMDRMCSLWQALDPVKRHCDLDAGDYGHVTWANQPPTNFTKLRDMIDMGYAGASIAIGEVMDTLSGPLYYFYL